MKRLPNTYRLRRQAAWTLLAAYSVAMAYLLFLGFSRSHRLERMYNLIPFKTISNYALFYHHYNFDIWFVNLFGNVAAFIPFGFLVPYLFPRYRRPRRLAGLFLLVLLAVEAIQYAVKVGSFDVDDVLLNLFGVMLGWVILIAGRAVTLVREGRGRGINM